ncbi:hypothetical protein FPD60_23910 [Salmonella enterica subsp. enterica]|uniref:hypothetical protein n=1 Tax=Salmonella enterica TaxID=28901 RepID=UPI0012759353|nr:hypothetical protein [Salmonella enterica]EBU6995582.1 hypothetical protein [Salmonella enterica subsp. enterica serovar Newport]EBV0751926.1 hypothetical protein [Salmonella enterica subsp. enterica serovar Potsdam]EDA8480473.1 hypothetical protein [Salmonella enterica subsp. enterica serovar Mikawasima]EDW0521628.1 hypothetical protein [Salmonella enterica subsp. enterica]EAZ0195601.1 hypothetical protein [Salmonella enterica]
MKKETKRGDTTVRINEERKLELKHRVLEIGNKTGELLKPSEIVNYLIDNYLDDAVKDLISREEIKKKKAI